MFNHAEIIDLAADLPIEDIHRFIGAILAGDGRIYDLLGHLDDKTITRGEFTRATICYLEGRPWEIEQ